MDLSSMCDVAQTMLLDQAANADTWAAMAGQEATHEAQLRTQLGLPVDDGLHDDPSRPDADVIVLDEYRGLADLAAALDVPWGSG